MVPPVPNTREELLRELQSLAETSAKLLTTAQVALLFGVCERTIRVWAKKKWIPAIHNPSGHWKFSATEIMHTYQTSTRQGQLPLHASKLPEV